jgi:hypothetical protein
MKFIFKAHTVIEAENLDDCFLQLSGHFLDVSGSDLEHVGLIEVYPLDEEDKENE